VNLDGFFSAILFFGNIMTEITTIREKAKNLVERETLLRGYL
jgi:hypothetical protein|tara:strand:+ start:291 stop:416 length:126 start_codon:yes stop_codon:yes gene_type:complete